MKPKYELQYTKDIDFVSCPFCRWTIQKKDIIGWDFIDSESHIVKCKNCKKEYKVVVNRPIEYVYGRKQDF